MPAPMTTQSFGQRHSNHYCDETLPEVDNPVDVNFEYFQCTATPREAPFKHQRNLFNPVIESMQQFNKSSHGIAKHPNNQTVVHKHREDEEDEQTFGTTSLRQQKTYKSHTRIVAIPNGVKIITEILNKEDDENDSTDSGSFNNQSQDENWMDKQIEVTVENDSVESDSVTVESDTD